MHTLLLHYFSIFSPLWVALILNKLKTVSSLHVTSISEKCLLSKNIKDYHFVSQGKVSWLWNVLWFRLSCGFVESISTSLVGYYNKRKRNELGYFQTFAKNQSNQFYTKKFVGSRIRTYIPRKPCLARQKRIRWDVPTSRVWCLSPLSHPDQ